MWIQKEIRLDAKPRGFHLITNELVRELPELRQFRVGMMNVFIMHTSASLTLNENADPTVRQDFERYFNHAQRPIGHVGISLEGAAELEKSPGH